jgi:hypothetical protein
MSLSTSPMQAFYAFNGHFCMFLTTQPFPGTNSTPINFPATYQLQQQISLRFFHPSLYLRLPNLHLPLFLTLISSFPLRPFFPHPFHSICLILFISHVLPGKARQGAFNLTTLHCAGSGKALNKTAVNRN